MAAPRHAPSAPLLATNTSRDRGGAASPVRGGFPMLPATLEHEHRQSLEFETRGVVGDGADSAAERGCARSLPVEERPATAKGRSFTPGVALVRRYAQGKGSVEETVLGIYHASLSVAEADAIAQALWGAGAGLPSLIDAARALTDRLHAWLNRPLVTPYRYVWLQAVEVKQKFKSHGKLTRLAVAVGLDPGGQRHVLVVTPFAESTAPGWGTLLAELKARGLRGTELFVGENETEAAAAVAGLFPAARYQGCLVHLEHEVLRRVPPGKIAVVWQAFKAIRDGATEAESRVAVDGLRRTLRDGGWTEAVAVLDRTATMQLNYFRRPSAHWNRLRDLDPLRRALREFRETIRQIGPVKDPATLVLLAAARLRWVSRLQWARRPFSGT